MPQNSRFSDPEEDPSSETPEAERPSTSGARGSLYFTGPKQILHALGGLLNYQYFFRGSVSYL